MLLQPDSELYIIPAGGGAARRLQCNTSRMNSWHSWSPNSRWLVFSSKAESPYTQLFLTHIDEQGESSAACAAGAISPRPTARPIFRSLSTRRPAAIARISSNSWTTSRMRARLMPWKTAAMWMRRSRSIKRR